MTKAVRVHKVGVRKPWCRGRDVPAPERARSASVSMRRPEFH